MSRLFKRKSEFSKTIVILDIVIFLLYIITNIVMMWLKGKTMPVDINTGVFAFLTGELGLLSFIKRSKLKAEVVQPITDSVQTSVNTEQFKQLQQLLLYNNNSNAVQGIDIGSHQGAAG